MQTLGCLCNARVLGVTPSCLILDKPDKPARCCLWRYSDGNTQWVHDYLANSLPALPQCGKKAVADMVESRPDFHPLSGWTHVQQLHSHKVVAQVTSYVLDFRHSLTAGNFLVTAVDQFVCDESRMMMGGCMSTSPGHSDTEQP